MQQRQEADQQRYGWVTSGMKDGSITLKEPFYATNPMYVSQHKEWDWQQCSFLLAEQGVRRQLGEGPTNGDAA